METTIKLIQVYQDYDGEVKADFVDKRTSAAFTTNEAQLQLRINDNRRWSLDVRVEECALNFIQRWPCYAAEVRRQREKKEDNHTSWGMGEMFDMEREIKG